MNKCDFCYIAKNIDGKCVCRYAECILPQEVIFAILDKVTNMKGE